MVTEREVSYFGMTYVVPTLVDSPEVILAVNVGGAVIPTLLSIYLLYRNHLWVRGLVATAAWRQSAMRSPSRSGASASACRSSWPLWSRC